MESDILLGKPFNNYLWRQLLNDICCKMDTEKLGLQIVAPWGFELLGKRYLSGHIRRYYCYIGCPIRDVYSAKEIKALFAKYLVKSLSELKTKMLADLTCIVTASDNHVEKLLEFKNSNYECQPNDKLVCVEYKEVDDILLDYARYMILTIFTLKNKNGEVFDYKNNRLARNRLFQLYVIQEKLYEGFIPGLSSAQEKQYYDVISQLDNTFQELYSPGGAVKKISNYEDVLVEQLINSRIDLMLKLFESKDSSSVEIASSGYHSSIVLSRVMPEWLYDVISQKLIMTYTDYV